MEFHKGTTLFHDLTDKWTDIQIQTTLIQRLPHLSVNIPSEHSVPLSYLGIALYRTIGKTPTHLP